MLEQLALKIRRRENPFYDWLYRTLKNARRLNFPVIRPLHRALFAERQLRRMVWSGLCQYLYYEPLFRSQCVSVGKGLQLIGGIPVITGNIQLEFGENVSLHGKSTLIGAKVFDRPTLRVGDNTFLGYMLHVIVGADITIGNNVLIAGEVFMYSYDQHNADPALRHQAPAPQTSKPIVIEDDVWIGQRCIIMKGVTIGKNSIVAGGSVVTQKVPPDSLVIGNPARVFPLVY